MLWSVESQRKTREKVEKAKAVVFMRMGMGTRREKRGEFRAIGRA